MVIGSVKRCLGALRIAAVCVSVVPFSGTPAAPPPVQQVKLSNGVTLHYVEAGSGEPVIFVHGSLSDNTYWQEEVAAFADQYHVVDYSRRYNYPNDNKPVPNYSAVTDAEDLAELIKKLHLPAANVIGHSYGAFAGLFLAARHPELLRRLVLAETIPGLPFQRSSSEASHELRQLPAGCRYTVCAGLHSAHLRRSLGERTFYRVVMATQALTSPHTSLLRGLI